MKCLKSLGFLILLLINIGIAGGVASQGYSAAKCEYVPEYDPYGFYTFSDTMYCFDLPESAQVIVEPATSYWELAAIAAGYFIVSTIIGFIAVWGIHILLNGLKQAVSGVIGPTYNDNRSINIVNIEGRRYIIKDDKAIPIDD